MGGKDAIKTALGQSQFILQTYLSDLSDADLLVRPAEGANHIAWQLGHLITSEVRLTADVPGATPTELPPGFAEKHAKDVAGAAETSGFPTKAQYLELLDKVRANTLATLDKLSDADLDRPNTGPMAKMAPTVGALLVLVSNHTLMHAGQFTVVRRKLGKPVVI